MTSVEYNPKIIAPATYTLMETSHKVLFLSFIVICFYCYFRQQVFIPFYYEILLFS